MSDDRLIDAAQKIAPTGNGTGGKHAAGTPLTISGTTTDATATGITEVPGAWITMICTTDFHIRFGTSAVAAATTSDMFWPAKVPLEHFCLANESNYFRAIQDSAGGTLYWYVSSR